MEEERPKPKYMIVYRCAGCGQESGFTENDEPQCRYCDSGEEMVLVSKKELTPEVLSERLKALADNMMKNLQSAFESMQENEEEVDMGDGKDPEKEMLSLLARTKNFREQIHGLELKKPVKTKRKARPKKKAKEAVKGIKKVAKKAKKVVQKALKKGSKKAVATKKKKQSGRKPVRKKRR